MHYGPFELAWGQPIDRGQELFLQLDSGDRIRLEQISDG
jgi:hypothetical protein